MYANAQVMVESNSSIYESNLQLLIIEYMLTNGKQVINKS